MFEIEGTYTTAKCYADTIEQEAVEQIRQLCSLESTKDSRVRIMPDAHAGTGCVIGCTMTITDSAIPNVVGVDIGCGMYTVELGRGDIDYELLDRACRIVPSGFGVWDRPQESFDLRRLRCAGDLKNVERIACSLGTLGGGNHFIEIDRAADGTNYLVIHSGSRNLGLQAAKFYQQRAIDANSGRVRERTERDRLVAEYTAAGRQREIQAALKELKNRQYKNTIEPALCHVSGQDFEDYLHDVALCQEFARMNRETMAARLVELAGLSGGEGWHTVHNYIDIDEMVLRKGSIRAAAGERVLIPLNMRDGSVVAYGRGNEDWNNSAPHGAGRLMSRRAAKNALSMDEYRASMAGVYTTSVSQSTLDEAPMAYKSADEIVGAIAECVDVQEVLKPTFNFKAQN